MSRWGVPRNRLPRRVKADRRQGRARGGPPVLMPAERRADAPLPAGVPLLAALGLAVLCICTVPAVRKQQRLQREYARLEQRTREVSREVDRLRRELEDEAAQDFLRRKARRVLLQRGADYLAERDRRLGR